MTDIKFFKDKHLNRAAERLIKKNFIAYGHFL